MGIPVGIGVDKPQEERLSAGRGLLGTPEEVLVVRRKGRENNNHRVFSRLKPMYCMRNRPSCLPRSQRMLGLRIFAFMSPAFDLSQLKWLPRYLPFDRGRDLGHTAASKMLPTELDARQNPTTCAVWPAAVSGPLINLRLRNLHQKFQSSGAAKPYWRHLTTSRSLVIPTLGPLKIFCLSTARGKRFYLIVLFRESHWRPVATPSELCKRWKSHHLY